jgi:metallo-beta-lactamase family protein
MLRWMEGFTSPPKQVLLVHGEPSALSALKTRIEQKGWPVSVPSHLERVELVRAS